MSEYRFEADPTVQSLAEQLGLARASTFADMCDLAQGSPGSPQQYVAIATAMADAALPAAMSVLGLGLSEARVTSEPIAPVAPRAP